MGLFDTFRLWRGGQPAAHGTPSASPAPATTASIAAESAQAAPTAFERHGDRDAMAGVAEAPRKAPPDTLPEAPPEAPLIHDDADAEALQRALDDELYGGPERRRRPRMNARPGTRVLIVDDSVTIVAVLRKMLQQNGFETLEAYTAEKALELIEQESPELVFLDIVLPGMDGFSALRAMRRHPATRAVPIIMISGNAQATEQFYVQRIGADDFMKKPFTRAEVFARIERLIDDDGVPQRQAAQPRPTGS